MAAGVMVFPSLFMSIFLAAGIGLPLGVPPLPEDPLLGRIAPEECLWYFSSAGIAAPDAESSNHTEQLLAEEEIQHLVAALESRLLAALDAQSGDRPEEQVMAREIPRMAKAILTRPFAIYVSDVTLADEGPKINAALMVNGGDQIDSLRKSMEAIQALAPPDVKIDEVEAVGITWQQVKLEGNAPSILWGTRGHYLIVGVGQESVETLMKNAGSGPPAWLETIRQQLRVERVSTVGYINAGTLVKKYGSLLRLGKFEAIIEAAGLSHLQHIASVSGMDDEGTLSQTLLAMDGQPTGLLGAIGKNPLAAEHLAAIPKNAVFAGAARLDAENIYQTVLDVLEEIEPQARDALQEEIEQFNQQFGVDLENDILAAMGDVWTIHTSPDEGGFPWLGAVATVEIRDRETLGKAHDQILNVARSMLANRTDERRGVTIPEIEFAGERIHFLNAVGQKMPVAPSWCLTKDHLVVGLFPQSVKGYLAGGSGKGSLADVPQVAAAFSDGQPPFKFFYIDTKTLVRTVYPLVQVAAQIGLSQLQEQGVPLDISLLPSASTILRHVRPSLATVARTEAGFLYRHQQTLPGGVVGTAPMAAALLLPGLQAGREAARRTIDMNSLRQIGLAMFLYENDHGRFPSAIFGEGETPGLSWRVALLPYLDQKGLYDQFHLDEPWDSEHNRKLISKMPELYRSHSIARGTELPRNDSPQNDRDQQQFAPFKTRFMTVRGPDTVFPGKETGQGAKLSEITDGTAQTLLVVQAPFGQEVIWTKPDDLEVDVDQPAKDLLSGGDHFLAVFCDGHVQVISRAVANEVLNALITASGGEKIGQSDF